MDAAISHLNELFGEEIDIEKIKNYYDDLKNRLQKLDDDKNNDGDGITANVKRVIDNVEISVKEVEKLNKSLHQINSQVEKHRKYVDKVSICTEQYMKQIDCLQKANAYFEVLQRVESISEQLESRISERGKQPISEYHELCVWASDYQNTQCENLGKYLKDTIVYWHTQLKDRLMKDFEEVLKTLKWPFIGPNVIPIPTVETIARFQGLVAILLKIQLPDWIPSETTSYSSTNSTKSLPMSLMLRPLKRRFLFHFSGNKQTNQSDKPEWYFTQILNWIKEHQEFVEKHVQPVYNKVLTTGANAKVELMRGLVQLAVDKLDWDLPQLQFDDVLFSHTVDEALGFANELREGYGYEDCRPNVIDVITQTSNFVKWINLEKKYSLEILDNMMRSPTAFQRNVHIDEGDFTTECTDKFITLLSTLTDRYSTLPQPGHRLQFLQLQLDLLDDFRVRLLQLLRENDMKAATSIVPSVLNSIYCLVHILEEWAVTPHFLQLNFYKRQSEVESQSSESDGSVFDEMITLFGKMQDDLLMKLTDSILIEVKARSREYRKERWHALDAIGVLSPSSVAMFQTLTEELRQLCETLTPVLRKPTLIQLAVEMDSFLYEELVCMVRFSTGGAQQFAFDVRKNLLPLFGQYISKPEAHFRLLLDSCTLLTLNLGPAMLVKSALLEPRDDDFSTCDVLSDVGVFMITPKQALNILTRRLDLLSD